MKRFILGSLSVAVLTAIASPALAIRSPRSLATRPVAIISTPASVGQLTPFNLVGLARQGYFREHDIPGYSALASAYRVGRVTAEDIIEAAIADNRLPAEVLDDQGYINSIDFQLDTLNRCSN